MTVVRSFPPIGDRFARVLILGSMPGVASLEAGQYYAHPRNAFWPIVCDVLGIDPDSPYDVRVTAVRAGGLALWDVLASCARRGSLDSAIDGGSVTANDIEGFLASHPAISDVLFNGATAETHYRRHVLPTLSTHRDIRHRRLPSTSPAHAAISRAEKRRIWRAALDPVCRARGLRAGRVSV